ncbi:DDE Tnp4 domain-containing protein [Balamuthia mandrillaris]
MQGNASGRAMLIALLTKQLTWHVTKKWKRHIGARRPQRRTPWRKSPSLPRNSLGPLAGKLNPHKYTGLLSFQFDRIYHRVSATLQQPRNQRHRCTACTLAPKAQLALVLNYLRDGGRYKRVADLFHVSRPYVCREIHHITPILYANLDYIHWPMVWRPHPFENVVGALDGTPHFCHRVHPRQGDLYRGDKHAHFVGAQITCSLFGDLYNVALMLGHNNDQANFVISGLRAFVEDNQIYLLADGGYRHHRLITPSKYMPLSWNQKQKLYRSVVETVIGLGKNWSLAAEKYRGQSVFFHAVLLMLVYQLVAMDLQDFPLRLLDD